MSIQDSGRCSTRCWKVKYGIKEEDVVLGEKDTTSSSESRHEIKPSFGTKERPLSNQQLRLAKTLPETSRVQAALDKIGLAETLGVDRAEIIARDHASYASSNAAEIVALDVGRKEPIRIYCKYEYKDRVPSFGHRGGVKCEALVYEHIVSRSGLPAAQYYGSYLDPRSDLAWFFIEYLDGAIRVSEAPITKLDDGSWEATPLLATVEWIAQFHAAFDPDRVASEFPFVPTHGTDYYCRWIRRAADFTADMVDEHSWLPEIFDPAYSMLSSLADRPKTLIHGEFTVHNVLYRDGIAIPVDWESAALGPWEIDFISITEGWDAETVDECWKRYSSIRWADQIEEEVGYHLDVARMYFHFRWLGNRRDKVKSEKMKWRFEDLRETAKRMGFTQG